MPTEQGDLVVQFLLSTLPAGLLASYEALAGLKYPIPDKHTLLRQLDELADVNGPSKKPESNSGHLIRITLGPRDFPIETPRSGLEKFHAALAPELGDVERADRDHVQRPDIAEIYEGAFGRMCGAEAIAAYSDALVRGATEIQALVTGHMAGEDCRRRSAQSLRDSIRRQREGQPRPWPGF